MVISVDFFVLGLIPGSIPKRSKAPEQVREHHAMNQGFMWGGIPLIRQKEKGNAIVIYMGA